MNTGKYSKLVLHVGSNPPRRIRPSFVTLPTRVCAVRSLLLVLSVFLSAPVWAESPQSTLLEQFDDLARWQRASFPKIKVQSTYTSSEGALLGAPSRHVLQLESVGGASVLILRSKLQLTEHSKLSWSWMVKRSLGAVDPTSKAGDDYAVRLYVMAPASTAPLWDRVMLLAADKFGDEKPGPTIAYVWTAHPLPKRCMPSPYTGLVRIIAFSDEVNRWSTQEVSPAKDFRECFGVELKGDARLAVMADSDNSRSSSLAYIANLKLTGAE